MDALEMSRTFRPDQVSHERLTITLHPHRPTNLAAKHDDKLATCVGDGSRFAGGNGRRKRTLAGNIWTTTLSIRLICRCGNERKALVPTGGVGNSMTTSSEGRET